MTGTETPFVSGQHPAKKDQAGRMPAYWPELIRLRGAAKARSASDRPQRGMRSIPSMGADLNRKRAALRAARNEECEAFRVWGADLNRKSAALRTAHNEECKAFRVWGLT